VLAEAHDTDLTSAAGHRPARPAALREIALRLWALVLPPGPCAAS
jgi:hypothetical protein